MVFKKAGWFADQLQRAEAVVTTVSAVSKYVLVPLATAVVGAYLAAKDHVRPSVVYLFGLYGFAGGLLLIGGVRFAFRRFGSSNEATSDEEDDEDASDDEPRRFSHRTLDQLFESVKGDALAVNKNAKIQPFIGLWFNVQDKVDDIDDSEDKQVSVWIRRGEIKDVLGSGYTIILRFSGDDAKIARTLERNDAVDVDGRLDNLSHTGSLCMLARCVFRSINGRGF